MAMMKPLELPPLGISERGAEIQFEKLQAKLIPLWESISGLNPEEQGEQTVVIVPSQSIELDCKGAEMQSYEERMLFLLMLLRQPRTSMIYVTSQKILPATTWSRAFIVRSLPTICSTSSSGMDCTSTRPARRAFSCTCCRPSGRKDGSAWSPSEILRRT